MYIASDPQMRCAFLFLGQMAAVLRMRNMFGPWSTGTPQYWWNGIL